MSRLAALPLALAITFALCSAGCTSANKDEGAASLPPAAGEGAPPRAPMPVAHASGGGTVAAATATETTGTTFPRESANVGPNLSGVIAAIPVREGQEVAKGAVLFRLRTTDFGLGVEQANAALKSAEVALTSARVEWERVQRLLEKNAINQAQVDRVKAQYDAAQAGVEQAKVMVSIAKKAMADATVRAPFSGIITRKLMSEGEMATMMPPSVVLILEDHAQLELRFQLPERALTRIRPGDTIAADFTAVEVTRQAKVERISPSVDARTRTVEIIALIDNADRSLKPGMLAKIDLGAASDEPAPAAAEAARAEEPR